jgi:hypothetical protein
MTRLDQLRMRRTVSSYGESLTFLEELELARLEAELDDLRRGRALDVDQRRRDLAFMTAAVSEA